MSQSLKGAGVGIKCRGGEFVGSGREFYLGGAEVSGSFLYEYPGLFSPGMTFLVEKAALQHNDFSDDSGGPAMVAMRHGDILVLIGRDMSIFD